MLDAVSSFFAISAISLIVGGAMGGVARWILLQPKAWSDRLGMVVLGGILGFYVSPQLEPTISWLMTSGLIFGVHFAVDVDKLPGFSAFATGVGGIALLGFAVDWVSGFRKQRSEEGSIDPTQKQPDGGKP